MPFCATIQRKKKKFIKRVVTCLLQTFTSTQSYKGEKKRKKNQI